MDFILQHAWKAYFVLYRICFWQGRQSSGELRKSPKINPFLMRMAKQQLLALFYCVKSTSTSKTFHQLTFTKYVVSCSSDPITTNPKSSKTSTSNQMDKQKKTFKAIRNHKLILIRSCFVIRCWIR